MVGKKAFCLAQKKDPHELARGSLTWWAADPASLAEGLIHDWSPSKNNPKSVLAPHNTPTYAPGELGLVGASTMRCSIGE